MDSFVLDTNILLDSSKVFNDFEGSTVIIPLDVIQELDAHKKDPGEVGVNARAVARFLDELSAKGDFFAGINFASNIIKVFNDAADLEKLLAHHALVSTPDNRILAVALATSSCLLTNDLLLRIKARALNVRTKSFHGSATTYQDDEFYSGLISLDVDEQSINELYSSGELVLDTNANLNINQYVLLKSNINSSHTALTRWDGEILTKVPNIKSVSGIKPKNVEQVVAFDALLDPDIDLITLLGTAGTGKTITALAAALEMMLEERKYDKIILMRAPIPVGREIGFLPGDMLTKIMPYFQAYIDNLEVIFNSRKDGPIDIDSIVSNLMANGQLELIPLTYVRGRSISRSIIILDEAQNLTKHEVKTIATRVGEDSKLIVMGDLQQIDTKQDAFDNGFTHLVECFKGEVCAAHVTLLKCERSTFASLAAERL